LFAATPAELVNRCPGPEVRAMMLLRANVLALGF
jgi:hypothetical protein